MRANRAQTFLVLALSGAVMAAGCAGKRQTGETSNPNLITRAEIAEGQQSGVRDLHEFITRVRPRWLQIRNERSLHLPTSILVYHNNSRLGGLDALRGYPLASISSIRYLDAAEAMRLPGAGSAHIEGAIVISTALVPGPGSS